MAAAKHTGTGHIVNSAYNNVCTTCYAYRECVHTWLFAQPCVHSYFSIQGQCMPGKLFAP